MMLVANLRHPAVPTLGIRLGPPLLLLGLAGQLAATAAGAPWALLPFLLATGASFGIGWAFLSIAVMNAAEPGDRDRAAGLVPTVQSAGYAIGAALTGLAASVAGLDGTSPAALPPAFAVVTACGLLPAAVAAWISLGRRAWPASEATAHSR